MIARRCVDVLAWVLLAIMLAMAAMIAAGCTTLSTPSGVTYGNALFNKSFDSLDVQVSEVRPDGTHRETRAKVGKYKSEAQAWAEFARELLQHARPIAAVGSEHPAPAGTRIVVDHQHRYHVEYLDGSGGGTYPTYAEAWAAGRNRGLLVTDREVTK